LKKYKKEPAFFSNVDWRKYKSRIYIFKNSNIIHLGDGLNFALLLSNDPKFKLIAYPGLEILLKAAACKNNSEKEKFIDINSLTIKPIGDLMDIAYFILRKPVLIVDLMDLNIPIKIPNYLLRIINNYNLDLANFKSISYEKNSTKDNLNIGRYIIVNTELASGAFRVNKYFIKKIINEAESYSKINNLKIVLVGTKKSRHLGKDYYFRDSELLDLRGKILLNDLLEIIASRSCVAIFSFDNLIMHIGNIFEKESYIKFRGKSNSNEEQFHFEIVNNSFRDIDNIKYL
jgi:hypothetical protein